MTEIELLTDNDIKKRFMQMITGAQNEILICTYKFGLTEPKKTGIISRIYELLAEAVKRNVDVSIVLHIPDNHAGPSGINTKAGQILAVAGVKVYTLKNNRTAHAKILCVDRQAVIIGSHNLTLASFTRNHETSVYIKNDVFARRVAAQVLELNKVQCRTR